MLNLTGIRPVAEEFLSFQRGYRNVELVGCQELRRLTDIHLFDLEVKPALECSQNLQAFCTELASWASKEFDLNAIQCLTYNLSI